MPKIFLSHSRVDQPKLKAFVEAFKESTLAKKHNLTFWLDTYDIDNFDEFPKQIERAIHSDDTCAFALHLSDSIYLENEELRPWIEEEVSLAKQRRRIDKSKQKQFAIVPFTLFDEEGKVAAPRTIAGYNTHSQVYENNRLNDKTEQMIKQMVAGQQTTETEKQPSLQVATDLIWLSFEVTQDNGIIQSICLDDDNCDNNKQIVDKKQLLPFNKDIQALQSMTKLLLGNEQHALHCINQCSDDEITALDDVRLRIRVVTDDPELAMLPWHHCYDTETAEPLHNKGWIVELTPPKPPPRPNYISCSLNSPLLVIPAK